ncbi:MAG: hypothetical protein Q8O67_06265 [Deltaproteobacteria bacterium]|nr:hypothetical protein [Deltaproteobacteria bacterium]
MRAAVVVVVLLCSVGCDPPTITFDVPITADAVVAEGGLIGQILGNFGFGELADIDLEGTSEFENEDVRREQVVAASMTQLNLTIKAPQGANFDWLDSVTFSVAADGEETERVASKTVDNGQSAIACDRDDVDLSPYIRAASMAITTEADAIHPPQDTTVTIDLNFSVTAEIL